MPRAALIAGLAFAGISAIVLVLAGHLVFGGVGAADAVGLNGSRWQETRWPFPIDQWGEGRAFRCEASHCGMTIDLYVRPKIGFCNCSEGVSDDAELDRLSDFDFMRENVVPHGEGHRLTVAALAGRARSFGTQAGAQAGIQAGAHYATPRALTLALNSKCDALVATAMVSGAAATAAEPAVRDFLGGPIIQQWIGRVLGG